MIFYCLWLGLIRADNSENRIFDGGSLMDITSGVGIGDFLLLLALAHGPPAASSQVIDAHTRFQEFTMPVLILDIHILKIIHTDSFIRSSLTYRSKPIYHAPSLK